MIGRGASVVSVSACICVVFRVLERLLLGHRRPPISPRPVSTSLAYMVIAC